ncbi:MAG TPA: restriction endonuclease subunit S [Brumimicrobium sp.]|nr:restriction endonuclease subunit S [Brumimicrobium sp.]
MTEKLELQLDKSTWTPVKFGDVVKEPKENCKDPLAEGIEHVVGLEHITSGDIHLRNSASIAESTTFTKKFAKGDVLFGRRRAYLKKAAQANFDGICSGDITVFRAKPNLLPELLPFIVNNEKFFDYAVKHSAGGLSPRVKFKDLANYEFLLPPKSEQARLAKLLWAMDEVIEREKEVLEKLDLNKRTLFNELHKLRFNSYNLLENLCLKISSGGTPSRQKEVDYFGGDIPWVKTKELNDWIVSETEESITDLGLKNSSAKLYPPNTILLAMYGVTVGKIGVIDKEMACNQACCALIVDSDKIDNWFLFYYLIALRERLIALSVGSAQPNISSGIIKKIKIPNLTIEKQRGFTNRFLKIDESHAEVRIKIDTSKSLQKSLINQVF